MQQSATGGSAAISTASLRQPPRPRHSTSSLSARVTHSSALAPHTPQRPRPRTTIEGGGGAAAASSASSASLQGAGIETVPQSSPIGPRDRSHAAVAAAAAAGGSSFVGGARPVWSNAYNPATAASTPPLPAVPARFSVKDSSSGSSSSGNNSAPQSNHNSPNLGTRAKRNISAAATATGSAGASAQSSARGSPPAAAAATAAAPFKLSTPSSLAEVLALSASAHAVQAAQAVPIAPRKSEARARSRNNLASSSNNTNPNPRHAAGSTVASSSSSSQLFASHGTPVKRTMRNGLTHGASNADLLLPLTTASAGSPTAAAPDALGELLPRAKALTLASRGGPSHKSTPALSPTKSNGTATPTPPLEPPASSLQQRSANQRKRGGGLTHSGSRPTLPASPEVPPSTSSVSPQQRAARKAHLSTVQPQVPSLAFPPVVLPSADLVSASAVAPASTSFSSAASSVSCPNNFPLPAHHNPLSDDDDAAEAEAEAEAEEQALQESLMQHEDENAGLNGQDANADAAYSEDDEDESCGGVAEVQGSFDGHALFDRAQHHPPHDDASADAVDDDGEEYSDEDEEGDYSVPAALSPPFVSQAQQQPLPSFDSALRKPASASVAPPVAAATIPAAQEAVVAVEPALRPRTPPPPPQQQQQHEQWTGAVSVAAADPATAATVDSPFARDRSPSFSSSLPRAPSALQHQHPLRGRVSAASLRPFTPNVAPIASTLETPPPTPPPHPSQQRQQSMKNKTKPKVVVAGVKQGGGARRGGAVSGSGSGGSKASVDRMVIAQTKEEMQQAALQAQQQHHHHHQQQQAQSLPVPPPVTSDEVSLTYDPILQCYYDPVAHIYYELS